MCYEVLIQEAKKASNSDCKAAYDYFDNCITGDAMTDLNNLAIHFQSTSAVVNSISKDIPSIVEPSPPHLRMISILKLILAIEHAVRSNRL